MNTVLTDEEIADLKRDYGYGANDLIWWEAVRAIEAAVLAKFGEPVCTKIEGNQFDTFKVNYEDSVKLKDLPVGTPLYAIKKEGA